VSRLAADTQPTNSADSTAITCRELVALVTDYLDGALPEQERARFEAHLERCEGCSRHLGQVRATIAAIGRLREDDLAPDLRDRMLTAFRGWKTGS
jgi:anti-sigma factor (TIGR02949 family)